MRGAGGLAGALVLAAICLSLPGCSYFPESSFDLSRDSRLPKWFKLPPRASRSDVLVTMDYYGAPARFRLLDARTKRKLAEADGIVKNMQPITLNNSKAAYPMNYPVYEVITVAGVTDIIEHRRPEPIFYITDDPDVRSKVLSRVGMERN
jgi:hypothetical protein